ncbi:hypothetical protein [Serratia fonticola]|uniref:DUF1311 domain-containing protein n=1 Tax=Serratia fonticola TaxID=47917 RepID=A0AAW3WRN8_SERFO|nr:hypothetical protein [Serratia fonticola]MBC3213399.1 hypothetical protein [Serratia fonticola]NYA14258.1 hypothetical protein [Serratia fonticola]NYA33900.1 hypothetical protein [Serratia fonticola]
MKINTSVIAVFVFCYSVGAVASDCSKIHREFQKSMESMFKCTDDEHQKVFDMDTSPTDIATSVIYSCKELITDNVKKQYDVALCKSAKADGITINEQKKRHPWYAEKNKIEASTKELLKEKYIADTVSYRAKIRKG